MKNQKQKSRRKSDELENYDESLDFTFGSYKGGTLIEVCRGEDVKLILLSGCRLEKDYNDEQE